MTTPFSLTQPVGHANEIYIYANFSNFYDQTAYKLHCNSSSQFHTSKWHHCESTLVYSFTLWSKRQRMPYVLEQKAKDALCFGAKDKGCPMFWSKRQRMPYVLEQKAKDALCFGTKGKGCPMFWSKRQRMPYVLEQKAKDALCFAWSWQVAQFALEL